jgi:hypothetical protein
MGTVKLATVVVQLDKRMPRNQFGIETLVNTADTAGAACYQGRRFVVDCRRYALPVGFSRLGFVGFGNIYGNIAMKVPAQF